MSNLLLRRLRELDAEITGTQHHVLMMLGDHANDQGFAWPSQATLSREGHRPRSTIKEAMKALQVMGLIVRDGMVGKAVRYRLDLPPMAAEERAQADEGPRNNQAACWPHQNDIRPPTGHIEPEGSGRPPATVRPPTGQGQAAHRPQPGRPPATEAKGSGSEADLKPTPSKKATATAAAREVLGLVKERIGKTWRQPHPYLVTSLLEGMTVDEAVLVAELKADEWKGTRFWKHLQQSTLFAKVHRADYLDQALEWEAAGRPFQGEGRPPAAPEPEKKPTASWPPGHTCEMTDDWRQVLAAIRERIPNDHVFGTYFAKLRGFVFIDGDRVLEVPNDFIAQWVAGNYRALISQEIRTAIPGDDGRVMIHGPSRIDYATAQT